MSSKRKAWHSRFLKKQVPFALWWWQSCNQGLKFPLSVHLHNTRACAERRHTRTHAHVQAALTLTPLLTADISVPPSSYLPLPLAPVLTPSLLASPDPHGSHPAVPGPLSPPCPPSIWAPDRCAAARHLPCPSLACLAAGITIRLVYNAL